MRLAYKFKIKKNNKLDELCKISKNLYNQANYIITENFKENKKFISYHDILPIIQNTKNLEGEINYRLLKSQCSQQILMLLDKNWKSFFKSIKDWKVNKSKYKGMPRTPKFLKNDKYLLIFTNQACSIKNNKLKLYKDLVLDIPYYKGKNFSNFKQVRILPKYKYYEIEIIYEQEIENKKLNYNSYSGIDLGINNLISFVSKEKCFLFDGKLIKSINQGFNKFKAKLQNQKGFNNYKLYKLTRKRNDLINDQFHKISRCIINFCIINKIGNIVIGKNYNWKDSINMGKRNNQKFVSISHEKLLSMIKYKAKLVGINVQEIEESYTSKCDSLALEEVKKQESYKGKRIKRGLFQSSIGKLINADINGALNIIIKVINNSQENYKEFIEIINSRVLFNPVKIRISDYQTFNNIFIKNFIKNNNIA